MQAIKLCFATLLMAFVSMANALTLNVSFLQQAPALFDVSYAVSTGDCSSTKAINCHREQSSMEGIAGAHAANFFKSLNTLFRAKTPVADKINKPSNFIEIKIPGQSGVCRANLLGKKTLSLKINKNGSCLKS